MNQVLLAVVGVSTVAGVCAAQLDPVDVVLETGSGQIETLAQHTGSPLEPECVFSGDITTGSTNDPGFDSLNGVFAPDQNVFLDILSHLRAWDGLQWVAADPVRIRITRGFLGPVFSPDEGAGAALGFAVAANISGKWHKHYLFTLEGSAPDPVYAIELGLRTDEGVPAASEPFWFVLRNGADTGTLMAATDAARAVLSSCGQLACPGDIADDFGGLGPDGQVSFGDFLALLGLIGPCPGGVPGCVGDIADDFGTLNPDGSVGFGDFLALLSVVGPCP